MQIIFDSRYDGLQDARTMLALLETFIDCHPAQKAVTPSAQFQVIEPPAASLRDILADAAQSAAPLVPAPSVAAVEPSPTVPEASTVGAPPPPPAPSPPAAPPTVPTAPAAPTSLVVDVTGLPWDERIHAANKAVIANGQWRKKKGLNDEGYINSIVAELRARHPVAATAPPPPPAPVATVAAPPPPVAEVPASEVALVPPPPPAPTQQVETFSTLMEWLGTQMSTGKIGFQTVVNECQKLGAKALADFASNPQFMPMVPLLSAALRAL